MIHTIVTHGLAINTYLVIDPLTGNAAVIDATRNVTPILQKIQETNANVVAILETHVHADFVSGSVQLKAALNGQPEIICSGLGGEEWIPEYADKVINQDKEQVSLGSYHLEAWHTPGHTPEHLMWMLKNDKNEPLAAMTGDFLFIGSVGRPDLLGEKYLKELAEKQYNSVFNVLIQLPDNIQLYPAHGAGSLCGKSISSNPTSTLQAERQGNPFLKTMAKDDWIEMLMRNMPPSPAYFKKMKQANLGPIALVETLNDKKGSNMEFILDIRSKEQFANKHLKNSINIGYGPSFVNWVAVMVPNEQPLLLVGDNEQQLDEALSALRLVGIDVPVQKAIFSEKLGQMESMPLIPAEELSRRKDLTVIDVRSYPEWDNGHIEGAIHILLNRLTTDKPDLPADAPIAVICGSGYRSSIGASLLKKQGFTNVSNVQGGMNALIVSS